MIFFKLGPTSDIKKFTCSTRCNKMKITCSQTVSSYFKISNNYSLRTVYMLLTDQRWNNMKQSVSPVWLEKNTTIRRNFASWLMRKTLEQSPERCLRLFTRCGQRGFTNRLSDTRPQVDAVKREMNANSENVDSCIGLRTLPGDLSQAISSANAHIPTAVMGAWHLPRPSQRDTRIS